MTVQALVFDFDGLILDTEEPEFRCWQEIYASYGCELAFETWAHCIGTSNVFDPYAYLTEQLGRPLDLEPVRVQRQRRFAELLAGQAVLPGVQEYVEQARGLGLKLGVASSSSRQWVGGHLARLGLLDRFEVIRCSDDVESVKPDPALYLAACASLGVDPARAVALEDSPNGILAAKRAGLMCVAVPNVLTARLDLSGADLCLRSLAEQPLAETLARLAR